MMRVSLRLARAAGRRVELDADMELAKEVMRKRPSSVRLSKAIDAKEGSLADGDLVHLTHRGYYVGMGINEAHPKDPATKPGMVHMLHYDAVNGPAPTDLTAWWTRRMHEAVAFRRSIGYNTDDRSMYRLVHGSGDGIPFVSIDVYGHEAAVLRFRKPCIRQHSASIVTALQSATLSSPISRLYARDDFPPRPSAQYIHGAPPPLPDALSFSEAGMDYFVNWEKSQKTGFYLDQRVNRDFVRSVAAGRDVLDVYAYTGGFSVAALHGGARSVTSVDASATYLATCERNVKHNKEMLGGERAGMQHSVHVGDAMKYLKEGAADAAYDLVIVDPPSLAETRHSLDQARVYYRRLNTLALQKLRPGGILCTFSCTHALATHEFFDIVKQAAHAARVDTRRLRVLSQPPDHPVTTEGDATEYLKGLALYVAESAPKSGQK